jgi:hypothetical protein
MAFDKMDFVAKHIADPDFRGFIQDPDLFVLFLNSLLDEIKDKKLSKKTQTVQSKIVEQMAKARIESLFTGAGDFPDLGDLYQAILNGHIIETTHKARQSDRQVQESAFAELLRVRCIALLPQMKLLPVGQKIDWVAACFQPKLQILLEQMKTNTPTKLSITPENLISETVKLYIKEPPDRIPTMEDYELADSDRFLDDMWDIIQWLLADGMEPASIAKFLSFYAFLKTSLPSPHNLFVNYFVLLALFNIENNDTFLSAAAQTFTSGIFDESSICTLDYWDIPRDVLMLFNPPTKDLKVMSQVRKRAIVRRLRVKATVDSGGESDESDSDEPDAAEPRLVDPSGDWALPPDALPAGEVDGCGFVKRSQRLTRAPVLLKPSHAPSLQPRPAPTPLQVGDVTIHNVAEVDRDSDEIEGDEGEISEGEAEYEREQAAAPLPSGKRAKRVPAGVKMRGKVTPRKAPDDVYRRTFPNNTTRGRRGAALNAE